MSVKLSYRSQRRNSRLTDFVDLKDFVLGNSVRCIPRTIKTKPERTDSLLSSF